MFQFRYSLPALGALLLALGAIQSAPKPKDNFKPATMPPGQFILCGTTESSTGEDNFEMMKSFQLKPHQYILSGGDNVNTKLLISCDLTINNGRIIFLDDDQVPTSDRAMKAPAKYRGEPIIFSVDATKPLELSITTIHDSISTSELWLHRADGMSKRLIGETNIPRDPDAKVEPLTIKIDLGEGFKKSTASYEHSKEIFKAPDDLFQLLPRSKIK